MLVPRNIRPLAALVVLVALNSSFALAQTPIADPAPDFIYPEQIGNVNDFTHALPEVTAQNMDLSFANYRRNTHVHFVLVVSGVPPEMARLKSCGQAIGYNYAEKLLTAWNVGKQDPDDHEGVVVTIIKEPDHMQVDQYATAELQPILGNPVVKNLFNHAIAEALGKQDASGIARVAFGFITDAVREQNRQQAHRDAGPKPTVPTE